MYVHSSMEDDEGLHMELKDRVPWLAVQEGRSRDLASSKEEGKVEAGFFDNFVIPQQV